RESPLVGEAIFTHLPIIGKLSRRVPKPPDTSAILWIARATPDIMRGHRGEGNCGAARSMVQERIARSHHTCRRLPSALSQRRRNRVWMHPLIWTVAARA